MPRAEAKYRITAEDRTARGIGSATQRLRRFSAQAQTAAVAVGGFFANRLEAAFQGIFRSLGRLITRLDDLQKQATEIGVLPEELEAAAFAADRLGISQQQLVGIVDRLSRRTARAIEGQKEYADAFRALAIDAEEFARLPLAERIQVLTQQLTRLEGARGRAVRESVEERLAGEGASRLFAGGFGAEIQRFQALGLGRGINEQADQAAEVVDATGQLLAVWGRLVERGGGALANSNILRKVIQGATDLGTLFSGQGLVRQGTAPGPTSAAVTGDIPLTLGRAARDQEKAAADIRQAARVLERVVNRYQ